MNTLMGHLIGCLKKLLEQDLISYSYPDAEEFDAAGLQIVYLGWFAIGRLSIMLFTLL